MRLRGSRGEPTGSSITRARLRSRRLHVSRWELPTRQTRRNIGPRASRMFVASRAVARVSMGAAFATDAAEYRSARVSMGAAFATDTAEYRSARVSDVWSMGACMRGSRRISRAVCAYEKRIALLATVFVRDLSGFTCGACLIASPLAKTSESAGKARASLRRGLEDLSLASASHAVQRS